MEENKERVEIYLIPTCEINNITTHSSEPDRILQYTTETGHKVQKRTICFKLTKVTMAVDRLKSTS